MRQVGEEKGRESGVGGGMRQLEVKREQSCIKSERD